MPAAKAGASHGRYPLRVRSGGSASSSIAASLGAAIDDKGNMGVGVAMREAVAPNFCLYISFLRREGKVSFFFSD
jgi:hypothetical protein